MTGFCRRQVRLVAIVAAGLVTSAGNAEEFDRERFFQHSWFVMEVIIFAYPRPAEATPPFLSLDREREAFTIPKDARALTRDDRSLVEIQHRIDANAIDLEARYADRGPRTIYEAHRPIDSYVNLGHLHFPTWLWDETPFWAWRAPEREAEGINLDQPGYRTPLPPLPPLPSPLSADDSDEPIESDLEILAEAASRFEASLTASRLNPERLDKLRRAERNIGRQFEILFAGRWVQEVTPRGQPEPVLIDEAREGEKLLGYLSFTLGRYLHLDAFLLRGFEDGTSSVLREQRRMRSAEVHYLDHPGIGVVARIDRLEVPQVLEDLAFRLNHGTQ